jgi:peptide/nickel transport system permease protein
MSALTQAAEAPGAPSRGRLVTRHASLVAQHSALVVATAVLLAIALVCAAAPLLPLPDPLAVSILQRYQPPGAPGHPLGTDSLGRDVLSRLIWGGRISIATGVAANLVVMGLAVALGLIAGYFGGLADSIIMRCTDLLLAFPGLLLALVLLAYFGPTLVNAVIAVVISSVPFQVRYIRGQVLQVRSLKFVEAARLLGYSDREIMFGEILPYIMPLVLTLTALHATGFFLATAGLSLLGLGVAPPYPDWGSMIGSGITAIYEAPVALLAPTLLITIIAVCFNVIGDEVQAILNPRSTG